MFGMVPYSRRNDVSGRDDIFGLGRFFDDFFKDPFFSGFSAIGSPIRANVKETDKEYIVEAEIPGVKKEDIMINITDDVLTLGVDMKEEKNEESEGYIYKERSSGSYKRCFHVRNIKNEDVKAQYTDGILTVVLPKNDIESGTRRIEIE